jgi:predicted ester cyclase
MMRNLGTFAALSFVGLVGCGGSQEPAATPLAPPPVASAAPAPAPVEVAKEEPKPVPLTPDQKLKFYQDGWAAFNAKDLTKFQTIFAENATSEHLDMGPPLVGATNIIEQGMKPFQTAFPDTTGELELTLLNGNTLVGLVLFRGTQTGTLVTPQGPVPPTGKKIGLYSAHIIELNDAGKAQKEIMADDGGTMAGQLGLMNMPHRKVVETGWAEKPVVIASGSDGEKANVAAFSKEVEGFNKHDAPSAMGTAADDIVFSEMSAPADRVGKKEAIKGAEEMFKGFPDAKIEIKSVWGAGDYVVAVGTWTGTNTGDVPSMKLKKTGKAVTQQFIEIDKFAAGKTKNIWLFSNGASAAAQLGLMPPPGAAKAKEAKPAAAKPEAKPAASKPAEPAMKAVAKPATPKAATPAK